MCAKKKYVNRKKKSEPKKKTAPQKHRCLKERVHIDVLGALLQVLVDPAQDPHVALVLADHIQADGEVLLGECVGDCRRLFEH